MQLVDAARFVDLTFHVAKRPWQRLYIWLHVWKKKIFLFFKHNIKFYFIKYKILFYIMERNNIITLENNVEWDSLYNSDKKLVVDFTATWCGPCQHIAPVFKDLSDEFKDLTFIKVDVDKFEDIVTDMNISCMPTFHFIYNQKILNTLSGADEDELKKYTLLLNEYLDHNSDSSLED